MNYFLLFFLNFHLISRSNFHPTVASRTFEWIENYQRKLDLKLKFKLTQSFIL